MSSVQSMMIFHRLYGDSHVLGNRDGSLDKKEIQSRGNQGVYGYASQNFDKLDVNKDKKLDGKELINTADEFSKTLSPPPSLSRMDQKA